jgi:hypothetical protein
MITLMLVAEPFTLNPVPISLFSWHKFWGGPGAVAGKRLAVSSAAVGDFERG